jgi:hypothetical protein
VGVNTRDNALQEGMGLIVDRTREHLGTTDRAIIVMRQLLLEAIREVEAGRRRRDSARPHVARRTSGCGRRAFFVYLCYTTTLRRR